MYNFIRSDFCHIGTSLNAVPQSDELDLLRKMTPVKVVDNTKVIIHVAAS